MKRCLNCGSIYHVFKNCNSYITSYGIIAYKKEKNKEIKYVCIQRKDTISFLEFIRGNYLDDDYNKIKFYLSEMTYTEIYKIRTMLFKELWESVFLNKNSKVYLTQYTECKNKFEKLNILELTEYLYLFKTKYEYNEYTFPKGRKNKYSESDLECAKREFMEETGIDEGSFVINQNIIPYLDIYKSTNDKEYRIVYFVAEIIKDIELKIDNTKLCQYGEIKTVEFLTLKEIYKKIRHYHIHKKSIIYKLEKLIQGLF